jgi:prepilin-type N-terminal cleavage/methylation domain-containing protein
MKWTKWFMNREKGFTLVELLVAIPIIGLLGLAMGAVLIQLLHSDRISQQMVAVRQVQAAGDRVSLDGVQAQYVTFGGMTDNTGFLILSWAGEWLDDDGTYNRRDMDVTYKLVLVPSTGDYNLERHESATITVGFVTTTSPEVISTVARYLDPSQMSCQWQDTNGDGNPEEYTFAFKVVSVLGTKTEERTYNVTPRPGG